MSKKKKGGKKGDEEAEEEIRLHLQLDIDTLENNIYIEKLREVNANSDYEKLMQKIINFFLI